MPTFDRQDKFSPDKAFSRVVWGERSKVLETELSEMQKILQHQTLALGEAILSNGFVDELPNITYENDELTIDPCAFVIDGFVYRVQSPLVLSQVQPESTVYIEVSEAEVSYQDTIRKDGNYTDGGEDLPDNGILDPDFGVETTRRVQWQIRLVTDDSDESKRYLPVCTVHGENAGVWEYEDLRQLCSLKSTYDVARKAEVDAVQTNLNNHANATTGVHGATSAATPNTLVQRDPAGRMKAGAPSAADDVARKAEVDAVLSAASTAVNAGYNEDPNTTQKAYILTNHANSPIGGTFWHIRTFFYGSLTGNRAQIAIRYANTDQMFIRRYNDGVWAPWVEVVTAERGFFNTDLVLPNGKGLYVRDTNGNVQLVGAINDSNLILLGDPDLPTYIRGTEVKINGNTAWHSGNDGAGSGLDADLLDGRQPSTSASANTIVQRDGSGRAKFAAPVDSDDAARKAEVDATISGKEIPGNDANNAIKTGYYYFNPSTVNGPGFQYGIIHTMVSNGDTHNGTDNWVFQVAYTTGYNAIKTRRKINAGPWSDWAWVWTSESDGPGSGLDSDLLDGIQAERFIYGDNARGTVHYAGDLNNITKSGFYYAFSGHSNGPSGANGFLIHHQMSVDNNFAAQTFIDYNNDRFYFRRKVDGTWQGWKKIWNESNDGPGSGLDADTVDGQHASAFWTKSEIPYETGTWTPELTFGNSSSGITYSNRKGRYTRIRNVVYWTMEMQLSSKGTATGTARISGLPFIPLSTAPDVILPVGYATRITLPSGGAWVSAQIFWNSAALVLFASGNVGTNAVITNEHFADSSGLKIQGFYFIPD